MSCDPRGTDRCQAGLANVTGLRADVVGSRGRDDSTWMSELSMTRSINDAPGNSSSLDKRTRSKVLSGG